MKGLTMLADPAGVARFIELNPDREVHWYPMPDGVCEEYELGDVVVDTSTGNKGQVTCPECLEWVHA